MKITIREGDGSTNERGGLMQLCAYLDAPWWRRKLADLRWTIRRRTKRS